MYRTTKSKFTGRAGLSAALAVGALATGVGVASVASASPHHSSKASASSHQANAARLRAGAFAPGDRGVVSDVTSSAITITDRSGASTTFTIDGSTSVTKDRSAATTASLAAGERVRITPSTTSASTAARIEIELAHVAGQVTSVSGHTVVVTDDQGFDRTIVVNGATTFSKAGASASLSDVTNGSFVFAEGTVDSNKTSLDAATVGIGQPSASAHLDGPGPMGGPGGAAPGGPGGDR